MQVKFNAKALEVAMLQLGERAEKGMSAKMRETAIKIRDLARDYAPVKTGQLEQSIDYITYKRGGRNSFVVFIDLDQARWEGDGQVGDYAYIMEEELHPYGRQKGKKRFTLGLISQRKAASGKKVGGRFLSRAVKKGTENLVAKMQAEVARTLGGRSVPMNYQRPDREDDE